MTHDTSRQPPPPHPHPASQKKISGVSLRVAVPSPTKVKRKQGNVYENLKLIVFCDATLIYAKWCNLIIFFAQRPLLAWKVIEINNNIEVNSFSIFSGIFAIQRPSSKMYLALKI